MLRLDIFVPEEVTMRRTLSIKRARLAVILGACMAITGATIPIFQLQLERETTRMRSAPKPFRDSQKRLLSLGMKKMFLSRGGSNMWMSMRGNRRRHR